MTMTDLPDARAVLRRQLLSARQQWADTPDAITAQEALSARLMAVLAQLEPDELGLYWPVKGEFNPRPVALAAQAQWGCRLALPFARREPVAMHYRAWSGEAPEGVDECGLPSPDGRPADPDVLLVPCLGFTPEGFRLGYGGGYFDRYLADHPEVTAIGLAWDAGRLDAAVLLPQSHDIALMAVLTESHTWG
jgi:5-formyltetrahydrofolate cyclo-ligase